MSCKYCDVKRLRKGAAYTVGKMPVGKPLGHSEMGYVVLCHDCGCPALPDKDEWSINWMQNGIGLYATINYCPMCGRRLPPKTEQEAKEALTRWN